MSWAPARTRRPSVQATMQTAHVPAPVGGVDAVSAASAMPPENSIHQYNFIAAEHGLRVRLGSREYATGITGAADNIVRTVIPYKGSTQSGTADKLFAATSSGIWDVTSSGATTTAWVGATPYAVGDAVTASGTTYICKVAGVSTGLVMPSIWATLTVYVLGNRVINDSRVYYCSTGGTSAGGPTGDGPVIVEGTVTWLYECPASDYVEGNGVDAITWRHFPSNVAPTLAIAFGITSGRAGYGVCHAVVTTGGHFLLYTDEVNGLYVYTEATTTWAAVAMGGGGTEISGMDPANAVHVAVWKNRVWLTERDTGFAWYGAAGSAYGVFTRFNFGHKFRAGGHLVGLWNWTHDGGDGIDDSLVAVSGGGDVQVWQGTDPASATTFGLVGVWFLGDVPAGRRIVTNFGGDMLMMSRSGIIPISKLQTSTGTLEQQQYSTYKIGPLFNQTMLTKAALDGWSMVLHPEDGALIVTSPEAATTATTQWAMSLGPTKGWGRYRDLPIYSCDTWGGKLYYGTVDGKVGINDGYVDGVSLADPSAYTPIQYYSLGAFQNLGNGRQKKTELLRPYFLSGSNSPAFDIRAKYDFDFSELGVVTGGTTGTNVWDVGLWDTAVWGGDYTQSGIVRGATGIGVHVAIALRGAAIDRTIYVGTDVGFNLGGLL